METTPALLRLHRLRVVRLVVVLVTLLAALPGLLALLPSELNAWGTPPSSAVIEIRHASFAGPDGATLTGIALPDTWAQRGQPAQQTGRYAATFTLDHTPGALVTWAVRAERMPNHHTLRVNGELIHDTRDATPPGTPRPVPTLISLPGRVLHAGLNTLDLVVETGERAGLSTLQIGPMAELLPRHQRYLHWNTELPEGLNAAAAGIALSMLLIWAMRRQEIQLGSFGAITLLACLRNLGYSSAGGPLTGMGSDLLFFLAQVASTALLGLFAMVYTGTRPRIYAMVLGIVVGTGLFVGVLAAVTHTLPLARRLAYPVLLATSLPGIGLLLRHGLRHPSRGVVQAQLAGWVLVLAAAMHDYAYQTGLLSITHDYALPLAVPVLVVAFSAAQLRRLMRGMDELARLNTELETRVATRTRELDHALQARSRFLAAASHDLRQPMATITLLLSLLREQLAPQSAALRALAQRLDAAAQAMSGLLDGLLDLSRLDSGRVPVRREAVALQPLLRGVVTGLDESALRKRLRLVVHPTTAVVDTDPLLLEQVLRNLAGNAVRYTSRGGVLLGVRPCGPNAVRLVVHDTGQGIAAADRERIFEAFVQLGNPARERQHGIGLGLSIAQRCARLLDSRLELVSTVGRGSCFSLVLPRAQTAPRRPDAPAAPRRDPADTPLQSRRIWVLEDDAPLAQATALRLQAWGAQVRVLPTCAALRHALIERAAAPDTLLTDLRLPDGDGLQALDAVRQRHPGCRALIVTGNTAPEELARLADSGHAVLHKPCRAEALLAALCADGGT